MLDGRKSPTSGRQEGVDAVLSTWRFWSQVWRWKSLQSPGVFIDASSRAPTAQGDGRNSNLARIVVDVPGASDTGVCKGTTDDVAVRRRVDQAQESSTKVKV